MFKVASDRLTILTGEADYQNSEAVKAHMINNMLPVIAIYQKTKLI